jgi:hypothetical protein
VVRWNGAYRHPVLYHGVPHQDGSESFATSAQPNHQGRGPADESEHEPQAGRRPDAGLHAPSKEEADRKARDGKPAVPIEETGRPLEGGSRRTKICLAPACQWESRLNIPQGVCPQWKFRLGPQAERLRTSVPPELSSRAQASFLPSRRLPASRIQDWPPRLTYALTPCFHHQGRDHSVPIVAVAHDR